MNEKNRMIVGRCTASAAPSMLTASTLIRAIAPSNATPVRRPPNSVLDGAKFRRLYGVEARPWRESLAGCLAEIRSRETTTA